jgi:hypothetical protein
MTNVAAGSYAISAKTIVDMTGSDSDWAPVCTLDAGGGSVDTAEFGFQNAFGGVQTQATLSLAVTRTFASTGSIVLRCRSDDPAVARNTKIVAIRVDTVTREAVSG